MTDSPLPLLPGPAVLLSPQVCKALAGPLTAWRDSFGRSGLPVPRGVAAAVEAIEQLAERADGGRKGTDGGRYGHGSAEVVFDGGRGFVSVADAARVAEVSPRTVRRALLDGRLAGCRVGGVWVVDVSALPDWRPRVRRM